MKWLFYLENDEDDVILLRTALRKAGCGDCVRWFRTAREFQSTLLQLCEDDLPKLILIDLKLDGDYGLDVAEWLSKHDSFRQIPTFVFSTGRFIHEIISVLEKNATGYLFKPSRFEEWVEIAQQLKQICEVGRGAEAYHPAGAETANN